MAGVAKVKLSGSTDGRAIAQVATATPGNLLHTAVAGTTPGTYDEIWLWAWCSTAGVTLSIEFGGTTGTDTIKVLMPANGGVVPVVPGLILQNGSVVRAYASNASTCTLFGFVNAISA